jgi:hypothetical protein
MLHRTVWEGSLGELEGGPASKQRPLFVKTRSVAQRMQAGRFASQLVDSLDVLRSSSLVTPDTFILCSEPVEWVSEWRVYACNGRILDITLYRPDLPSLDAARPEMLIDFDLAEQAVSRISVSDMSIAGYCLDIGVLGTGQTALVELNDGIALANYGLSSAHHAKLHLTRWRELMSQIARGQPQTPTLHV